MYYVQSSLLRSNPTYYFSFFFFFTDTATTEIYTLSLHDALPISAPAGDSSGCTMRQQSARRSGRPRTRLRLAKYQRDRKSTRLNSSHTVISYAVFCLKKKKQYDNVRKINRKQLAHTTPNHTE